MKHLILSILALGAMISGGPVKAESPVVVELFTSQGCSSCPPADRLMHELAKDADVIGLALHVDYWDYIGWKDEYADPSHAVRQQGYAETGGRSMIYTPQMIVNGKESVVGARGMELMKYINWHKSAPALAQVDAIRNNSNIKVTLTGSGSAGSDLTVQLVQFTPLRKAKITRGELAGHKLDYANVVESWDQIGTWNGRGTVTLTAELEQDLPAVVLVQRTGHGPIIAATRVRE
ncbi:MAG: DUF1223 domain-containing protein [Pseudomonadota bacterium]